MWSNILQLGDFIKNETKKGISITSKDGTKRYYYQEGNPAHILIMFNPSTGDGNDQTVNYLREFNSNFAIVNLIPSVAGNPGMLTDNDFIFDPVNFRVIQEITNRTNIPIWIGWGELVKKKTQILLPKEFRELLTLHKKRLVQIDRTKSRKWFPLHPAYAKINIPVQDLKLASFDVKNVLKYI
ncbi:DUF1643 domain-containing protein [Rossellomorea marisflavi]|uniref:DUF1643 domain-containing protein n=1 Tax=Rossellomorea marisflavi TaxID=189381 RepID=UPI003D2EC1C0